MKGDSPKETIHGNMLENFNLMHFRCIRCSSNEFFQVNDINQQLALYVIACLTCKKCNNRISVTVLDHGKMKQ